MVNTWCGMKGVDCLFFLSRADDPLTCRLAEQQDFQLTDIRVELKQTLTRYPARTASAVNSRFRRSAKKDIGQLEELAKLNHRDTRFYFDASFPRGRCHEFYASWIRRSCEGEADNVIVATVDHTVVGYISCHIQDENLGRIGLLGVSSNARSQGIGSGLLNEAQDWFIRQGINQVTVVTQGRNVQAQRLYQKHGFLPESIRLWYHKWPKGMDN